MVYSYINEELLNQSILKLTMNKRELSDRNQEFERTTTELIGIQKLLSSNQEILKQEKDRAENALKVKTDFLSNMSHEIRTPMNVIVGLTDLLIDIENDTEKQENLELIKNSSNNLLVIINDILDFSKMESGKLIIETIEFNLPKKIKEIIRTFTIRTNQRKNKLNLHIDDNVPPIISSDPVRITQVLMNLLSNANKFTKKGSIDIYISSISRNRNKSFIKFEVRDTGIGIENKAQDKIFDSFTQASSSTTRKFGGTGLGLPICKRIIEIMDGKFWVQSEKNRGSSFFFELPINHNEIKNSQTNKRELSCLINEDFEMNQLMLTKILTNINITPSFTENIDDFEHKIQCHHFDLLLLDLSKDDFPISEIQRVIKQKPTLQVLAFDNITEKDNIDFKVTYIQSPINKDEILKSIKNLFVI